MNFKDLHELLRLELLKRIDRGMLTGSRLASQAGFRQAHISNFLNNKRALSLEGLDRVLAAQNLTVEHILPLELTAAATLTLEAEPIENLPVVSPSVAMDEPRVAASQIIETLQVTSSRLHDHRARPNPRYSHWQRFLAVRADAEQAAAMDPVLQPGSLVVIDRHYNSLAPYRAQQPTLYAVRTGTSLLFRYLSSDEGALILRPRSLSYPVLLLSLGTHEAPADYIVGRVCMIVSEL